MKKLYLVAPLAALLVFGGLYATYSIRREHALAVQQAQAETDRLEKIRRDQAAVAASREAAAKADAERRQARLARAQHDAALKDAQAAAERQRTQAFEQERKLRTQIERRRTEVARATESLAVLTPRQKELADESAFLADYLTRAEPNREAYVRLVEKIDAAEKLAAAPAPAPSPR